MKCSCGHAVYYWHDGSGCYHAGCACARTWAEIEAELATAQDRLAEEVSR